MKIRIEVDIGDKHIAEEFTVPDETFIFARYPDGLMSNVKQELWNRMAEGRQNALTEFFKDKAVKPFGKGLNRDVLASAFS
jgi:hypothetical protein